MARVKYPLEPRQLNKLAWYYEEPKGLTVCVQPREGIDAGTVTIPWRKIRELAKKYSS